MCSAVDFAHGIRGHWGIENPLNWVKDVIFDEDRSAIRMGNAPANRSVILAIALNVLRRNGYSSITSAQRLIANDIEKLFSLVE
jgi:predicted transposase YbfD/YdcC